MSTTSTEGVPSKDMESTSQKSTTFKPNFLSLPREVRDEVYRYLVVKPINTITMLESQNCFQNPISAAQPAISRVNKQIRAEALPIFYKSNIFLAELAYANDLETATSWLQAIGDIHASYLRRLRLFSRTLIVTEEFECHVSIRLLFDLKNGTLNVSGNEAKVGEDQTISKDLKGVQDCWKGLLDGMAASKKNFDVESLTMLMENFHRLCVEPAEECG